MRRAVAARRWRRTRTGLLLTSIGLFVLWLPLVAALGAFFLSFGSTFFFLGARAAGRRHEVSVAVAFLLLSIGGVLTGVFFGAFLLEASYGVSRGYSMALLEEPARRLLWDTVPGTLALAAGIAVQVHVLVPREQRRWLYALAGVLVITAIAATWLAEPELAVLDSRPIRGGSILEFLLRLSAYRLLEAPAYLGLAAIHLRVYLALEDLPTPVPSAAAADPPA
jgi:hypothetical protein